MNSLYLIFLRVINQLYEIIRILPPLLFVIFIIGVIQYLMNRIQRKDSVPNRKSKWVRKFKKYKMKFKPPKEKSVSLVGDAGGLVGNFEGYKIEIYIESTIEITFPKALHGLRNLKVSTFRPHKYLTRGMADFQTGSFGLNRILKTRRVSRSALDKLNNADDLMKSLMNFFRRFMIGTSIFRMAPDKMSWQSNHDLFELQLTPVFIIKKVVASMLEIAEHLKKVNENKKRDDFSLENIKT